MTRAWVGAAVLLVAVFGCEKDRPAAENPKGPTVIVEQPGGSEPSEPGEAGGVDEPGAGSGADDGQAEFGSIETVATDVPCQSDADCVKDSCCHATSCVAVVDAPSCADVACTMDCQAGTTDCYGGCVCQAGRCAAQRWTPPAQP